MLIKTKINILIAIFLVFNSICYVNANNFEPVELTWTSGGVGGTWYIQAAGIAELINEKEPNITIKVVPGGGMLNPARVGSGDVPIGFGLSISDSLAYMGKEPFETEYKDLRTMGGPIGVYNLHFIAAKELGLNEVEEVIEMIKKGKPLNIATTTPGASDYLLFKEVLSFYGLSFDDIEAAGGKISYASYSDMANLYKDKHVDFTFTNCTPPVAHAIESNVSRPISLLSFSRDVTEYLYQSIGLLSPDSDLSVIKGGTYQGIDKDIIYAPATSGTFIVNKNVSEEIVYTVTKILCENKDRLIEISAGLEVFDPEEAWKTSVVPLHVGAERYYKEMNYIK